MNCFLSGTFYQLTSSHQIPESRLIETPISFNTVVGDLYKTEAPFTDAFFCCSLSSISFTHPTLSSPKSFSPTGIKYQIPRTSRSAHQESFSARRQGYGIGSRRAKELGLGRCMALRGASEGHPLREPVGQPSRSNEGAMRREIESKPV